MDQMGNLDRACSQDGYQPHQHPLDADAQSDARPRLWLGDRLAREVGAQALDGLPRLVLWNRCTMTGSLCGVAIWSPLVNLWWAPQL